LLVEKEEILNSNLIDYYLKASTWEEIAKITITGSNPRTDASASSQVEYLPTQGLAGYGTRIEEFKR